MMKPAKDLREFIELLNFHDVRYLVVGGHAVAYHGHPRSTGDIDFFVEISDDNARKHEAVVAAFGFTFLGLTANDFLEPKSIIQLGKPPNRIDLLTSISGVDFASAWPRRVCETVDGLPILFIDRASLLINKAAAGRPKDLGDISALS